MYQIASLYELLGDMGQAVEWYFQVIGLVPTDPAILQKMATIYDNDGDKQQAYQYYFDSYRYNANCSRLWELFLRVLRICPAKVNRNPQIPVH